MEQNNNHQLYTVPGTEQKVEVKYKQYQNGTLAVLLTQPQGTYAVITVNLQASFDGLMQNEYCAYLDTNNCPWVKEFVEKNNLGRYLDWDGYSGFCTYPLYAFYDMIPKKEE